MSLSSILRVGSLVAYSGLSQEEKDDMEKSRMIKDLKKEALNGGSQAFADFLNGGGFDKIKHNVVSPVQAQ